MGSSMRLGTEAATVLGVLSIRMRNGPTASIRRAITGSDSRTCLTAALGSKASPGSILTSPGASAPVPATSAPALGAPDVGPGATVI